VLRRLLPFVVSPLLLGLLLLLATGPRAPEATPVTPPATAGGATTTPPDPTSEGDAPAAGGATTGSDTEPVELRVPTSGTPTGLDAFYGQQVDWASCGDATSDECGSVTVPVDYAQPSGPTVRIAMRKVPASAPSRRKGSLFINPGGPGASGLEFAADAREFFSNDILDVWDVVGFDPRGIGESGGFECLRSRDLDAMYAADPTPDTKAERAALVSARAARLRGCLQRGGLLARNMGTELVARDLDILRDAVGDTHLNYYGVSYGTLLGALYADQFTDRVGLMVIDSAVSPDDLPAGDPTQDDVDAWVGQAADEVEATFDDFLDDCVAGGDCPLGGTRDTARSRLLSFLDGLDRHPLPSDAIGIPRLTEGWAVTALDAVSRVPESWPDVQDALATALDGDGTDLVWVAEDTVSRDDDGTYYGGFESVHLPIHCADWPLDTEVGPEPSRAVLQAHPVFAHLYGVNPDSCEGWDGTPRSHLVLTVTNPSPVLVLGNEGDLTTPLDQSQRMSHAFLESRFVSVEADGHGVYANGNACADRIVEDYLVRAEAPRGGAHCAA
jgi:pimeloyl-ACP methyl ester carboxylesterase